MKRLILVFMLFQAVWGMHAQTMREVWIQMPDTIAPYLTESNRTELADYMDMGVEAELKNSLGDTTRVVCMTNDYLSVQLNAATQLELKLLEKRDGGKVICMVTTYLGPAAESALAFYTASWERLEQPMMRPVVRARFMQQPEDMSDERFEEIRGMLEPALVEMHLSSDDRSLIMGYSLPELPEEDIVMIKPLLVQTKLNWNGERFN